MSISNGVSHIQYSKEQLRDISENNFTVCGVMKESGDVYRGRWSVVLNPADYIGFIFGPSVLGRDESMLEKLFLPENLLLSNTMSTVGAIHFVFITSVKIDKSRIFLTVKKAWNVNLTCLVAPFIISTSLFYLLQKYLTGFYNAPLFYLYLGFATSLSHCLNVTHALGELNLLNSELGQLAFNINVCNSRASMKLCLSQLCIVFTVLHPLMLWIIKNTPEGKPVKLMYVRLILVAPLITAMLTEAAGTTFFTRAQMMGLIIPKSELIMSELFLPFFFIHKVFWALIFILIVESFSKMIGSLSSLLCVNTSVWNAILLSFILNFKGVIEHNVILWLRMQKLVDDSYFTSFVLSIVAVNAIMSPLIQIFYKPELRLEDCLSFGNHPRRLHSMPSTGELRVLCCIHCEYNVNGMRAWRMSVLVIQCFGISSTGTESSMTNSNERSCLSFPSSNRDRDNDLQALVAYHKRNATLCTQV
ncbi:hypothetical protein ACOSQ2_020636 [Xanthoceras sorbifolium]